ncbi:unnamed protein product, partial [Prunus armeniaca]
GFRTSEGALNFALRMNFNGVVFDPVTYTTILAFCADHEDFLFGLQLHSLIFKSGLDGEVFVGNALISYSQEGNHGLEAIFVFIEMVGEGMGKLVEEGEMIHGFCIKTGFLSKHNVCNSLGYAPNGLCHDALKTFLVATMESKPNNYTFGSVLSAIGDAQDISLKYGQ